MNSFKKCVRCGYCCKKATCSIGLSHGAESKNCKFLVGNKIGEYSCALVNKMVASDIKMHLAIGEGCSSPLNSDRRIAIIK